MRRGFNSEFLIGNKGDLLGINLGADFCSEHEWGIDKIERSFDIKENEKIFGVKKRMINKIPEELIFEEIKFKNKKHFVLILFHYFWDYQENKNDAKIWMPSDLYFYGDDKLVCAWDENSFGILVDKRYEKEIKELYEAFQKKDIAIGISPSHAFKNGGLVFTIASKLSKDIIDEIYEKDKDYYVLQQTAKTTGIYELLEKVEKGKYKGWMALSPRWKDSNKKERLNML